jgi:uncharacterized protein (TIGR01777 family)
VNVTLTGASGFLGNRLIGRLLKAGHRVHVLGRKRSNSLPSSVSFSAWDALIAPPPTESLADADAVIHLVGEPVAQRWNASVKWRIMESRRLGTKHLVQALAHTARKPSVLVSASATGYYGDRGEETLIESSDPGMGFLPEVCIEWERNALSAVPLGIRVVTVRIGLVLGKEGGALAQMLTPFKLGVGGRLGSGQQWMSWIHVDDLIDLFLFAMEHGGIGGAVNGVSTAPVRNADFTASLAKAVNRPAIFPVPLFGLKMMFGEMAEIVLSSQRVLPKAAQDAGFEFQYRDLDGALADVLK